MFIILENNVLSLKALNDFNKDNHGVYPEVSFGYGIHTGFLTVGTLGEPERMEATVISDTVNTASRLEV